MNKLVREHYPVSNLPEDLREGLDGKGEVTVTIETHPASDPAKDRSERDATESWVERGKRVRQANFASSEDVDAYVRSLRE